MPTPAPWWTGSNRIGSNRGRPRGRDVLEREVDRPVRLLLGFVFAVMLIYLGIAPADPLDRGDRGPTLLAIGVVWTLTFGLADWYVLATEFRVNSSRSGRVVRSRR